MIACAHPSSLCLARDLSLTPFGPSLPPKPPPLSLDYPLIPSVARTSPLLGLLVLLALSTQSYYGATITEHPLGLSTFQLARLHGYTAALALTLTLTSLPPFPPMASFSSSSSSYPCRSLARLARPTLAPPCYHQTLLPTRPLCARLAGTTFLLPPSSLCPPSRARILAGSRSLRRPPLPPSTTTCHSCHHATRPPRLPRQPRQEPRRPKSTYPRIVAHSSSSSLRTRGHRPSC